MVSFPWKPVPGVSRTQQWILVKMYMCVCVCVHVRKVHVCVQRKVCVCR